MGCTTKDTKSTKLGRLFSEPFVSFVIFVVRLDFVKE